jgi:RNA polymerase sigma-70 factor (ECF subfamily)
VNSTSRSLIASAQDNDARAWRRLVELYQPLVVCWCRWQRVPEQDIHDVFQDVLQAVSINLHKFRNDRPQDTFRGWLRIITRNKINDYFRRADSVVASGGTEAQMRLAQIGAAADPCLEESEEPSRQMANEEQQATSLVYERALEVVRSSFEERTWQAFWGVVVDGRPTRDVAEELHMQPGAVRVAKCRVLNRLRKELGELAG